MEFSPNNPVVRRCIQAMGMEAQGKAEKAVALICQAWDEATADMERFLAAFFMAQHKIKAVDRLKWLETALHIALNSEDVALKSTLFTVYSQIGACYHELGEDYKEKVNCDLANASNKMMADKGPFYHGTRADLKVGDLLIPGGRSNYKEEIIMNHIYFTALVNGAGLAAALAKGDIPERVYIIEPTDHFENDPNVTDKKFPGNLTRSYRSASPLQIVGEVTDWVRVPPEELRMWREKLANNTGEIIN